MLKLVTYGFRSAEAHFRAISNGASAQIVAGKLQRREGPHFAANRGYPSACPKLYWGSARVYFHTWRSTGSPVIPRIFFVSASMVLASTSSGRVSSSPSSPALANVVNTTIPFGARPSKRDEFQIVQKLLKPSRRGTMKPNPSRLWRTAARSNAQDTTAIGVWEIAESKELRSGALVSTKRAASYAGVEITTCLAKISSPPERRTFQLHSESAFPLIGKSDSAWAAKRMFWPNLFDNNSIRVPIPRRKEPSDGKLSVTRNGGPDGSDV